MDVEMVVISNPQSRCDHAQSRGTSCTAESVSGACNERAHFQGEVFQGIKINVFSQTEGTVQTKMRGRACACQAASPWVGMAVGVSRGSHRGRLHRHPGGCWGAGGQWGSNSRLQRLE